MLNNGKKGIISRSRLGLKPNKAWDWLCPFFGSRGGEEIGKKNAADQEKSEGTIGKQTLHLIAPIARGVIKRKETKKVPSGTLMRKDSQKLRSFPPIGSSTQFPSGLFGVCKRSPRAVIWCN